MTPLPLRPLGPRVLVAPTVPERVTRGGIQIPDSALTQNPTGTVLAVGPGCATLGDPFPIHIGDVVHFASYAGTPVTVTNTETGVETTYLILLLDDLIAVKTPTEVLPASFDRDLAAENERLAGFGLANGPIPSTTSEC
jgi:chaperonin GroES